MIQYSALKDEEIITHLCAGEGWAMEVLYDRYDRLVFSLALKILRDRSAAEEVVQEVFVKVSRALPAFRGEAQLSTWLYRIATNTAIDKMRTASFRQEAQIDGVDETNEPEDVDLWSGEETPSLEQQVMRKEMYACFIDYVKRLPGDYRAVVVLSELEELPNSEIADILGLSVGMVKIRLHRGRSRLFQELKTHCQADDWL